MPNPPRDRSWAVWIVLVAVVLVVAVWRSTRSRMVTDLVGQPLPPLAVAGWLQADPPPSDQSLRGRVVLVDFWASWCMPCRANMPKLVDFAHRFRDQGVVVIGLTPETGPELDAVRQYVATVEGLDWPIGYGAVPIMQMLGINMAPTYVLFDRSGTSIWASHHLNGVEDAAIEALARE